MMKQQTFGFLNKVSHAVFSEDRVYRYALFRSVDGEQWDQSYQSGSTADPALGIKSRRMVCFVLINPSTADEYDNDPTIDKLTKYTRAWGFERFAVVNLFAYCETDSTRLPSLASRRDIIGPHNDAAILKVAGDAHQVVCGWGNQGVILDRGRKVKDLLSVFDEPLWCFKTTSLHQPIHPLYQADAAELVEYR